jgi:hypothetical protein
MSKSFTPVTPHGELTKVMDNVYVVQGSYNMAFGVLIGRCMTIVKQDDELTILNSLRVNEDVEAEIKKLGTVKNVVRMCASHGCDDTYYTETFPDATYWSLEGVESPKNCKKCDKVLTEDGEKPIPDSKVILPKFKIPEAVMWIPNQGGTLISVDFLQNTLDLGAYTTRGGKFMTKNMGFMGPCKCVPLFRMLNGTDYWDDVERILDLDFENLLTGHGEPKIGGARPIVVENLKKTFKKE